MHRIGYTRTGVRFLVEGANMSFFKTIASAITSSLENPEYEVVKEHEDFEVRRYPDTKWVSTKIKAMAQSEAGRTGFRKLFNYIQGKNEKEQKIDMTAPVSIRVEPGAGPNCESTFTVSFYIGKEHHESPPKPTDSELYIDTWPPMELLSRRFSGFTNDEKNISQATSLMESTEKEYSGKFHQEFYYTAGYDSPYKLFNRRNEIWFIMKSGES